MYKIKKIPGRTVEIESIEHLWFGGTSYLGMQYNSQFQLLIQEGFQKYGSNWGSSRNNPLQIDIFEIFEAKLAGFVGAEGALTVSSGMLAGQLVVKYLESTTINCQTIYAPKVHPALWGQNYKPNALTFKDFSENINSEINKSASENFIICSDSISSPTIENFYFSWIKNLPTHKPIYLVIDDSHSLGVLGESGRGIFSEIEHNSNVILVVVSSLNKAFGIPGGVIFSKNDLIFKIKNYPYFSSGSPMSPAFAYAGASAETIYQNELQKLNNNITFFEGQVQHLNGITHLENQPTYSFGKNGIIDYLAKNKVLVPNFAYPLPSSLPVNRLVISSLHTYDDLAKLALLIKQFDELSS